MTHAVRFTILMSCALRNPRCTSANLGRNATSYGTLSRFWPWNEEFPFTATGWHFGVFHVDIPMELSNEKWIVRS
ncbi:hypothetical protein CDAR_292511 [Caerostris darwini]|uniref:Secreted protein n=1 Tax=Caerostris darwini TaxID=1538125 RepID=A0AAV4QKE8_9ARAC|nr:hypothetical protein CDAR_292511 [Caerostris darwini]